MAAAVIQALLLTLGKGYDIVCWIYDSTTTIYAAFYWCGLATSSGSGSTSGMSGSGLISSMDISGDSSTDMLSASGMDDGASGMDNNVSGYSFVTPITITPTILTSTAETPTISISMVEAVTTIS